MSQYPKWFCTIDDCGYSIELFDKQAAKAVIDHLREEHDIGDIGR